jgi:hypothetical protein
MDVIVTGQLKQRATVRNHWSSPHMFFLLQEPCSFIHTTKIPFFCAISNVRTLSTFWILWEELYDCTMSILSEKFFDRPWDCTCGIYGGNKDKRTGFCRTTWSVPSKDHSIWDWCTSIASIRFTEDCERPDQPVLTVTSELSRKFTSNSAPY